ncbi:sulfite exporter TauE/SafE family protein [Methanolacinia petrolearia]|uniref:sulfite exporter TauE/SafE family protein n=1 Tax=Methanolacinia petrolearia TaxID=54120 RepID=UPI003BA997BE
MTPEVIVFIVVIAFIVGMIASILGIGGGTLNVPVLILVFSFDQITAIALSLTIGVAISFTSMVNYAWQQRILYKTALFLGVPAVGVSVLSVLVSISLPVITLKLILIAILLVIASTLLKPDLISLPEIKKGPEYHDGCKNRYGDEFSGDFHALHMITWGSSGGLLNGLTGLGGGSINVPAMIAAKIPPHYATATSTMVVFLACMAASIMHAELGNIHSLGFLALYITGAVCGAVAGTRYARKLRSSQLSFGFGLFLIFVCIIMAVNLFL